MEVDMIIKLFLASVSLILFPLTTKSQETQRLEDPFEILEKHYEAVGGLEILKAHKTIYSEGKITLEGTGLYGTFRKWEKGPLKEREEVDLNILKQVSGDNGEYRWSVDRNGKKNFHRDESTLKRREVKKLMCTYEHLNPESPHFTITFEGAEKFEGEDCYALKIENSINKDIVHQFYDMTSFYLLKEITEGPDEEEHIVYSDFREIDGVIYPFKIETEVLPTEEKILIEYTKYEVNIEMDDSLFTPPEKDIVDFEFLSTESAEDIPFKYIENHIFLPVNINGKERLWVLDCGASVNVIDSAFARELGLEIEGMIKAQSTSTVVNLYHVTLPPFKIKGIKFREQKIMALKINDLFRKSMGLEVVGILGYDFLSRFITKIDFANEKLSFYSPDSFVYNGNGKIIDAPLADNLFSIPVTVDKKYSGIWELDIGASGVGFNYPFSSENNLLQRTGIDGIAFGAGGGYMNKLSQFQSLEINGYVIKNPLIAIPYEEGKGAHSGETQIGVIGNSFLQHFVLYMDYRKQRIILEKGDDFTYEFPRGKSGLALLYNEDNDIEVLYVPSNTPAEESGFKKGDIIKAINEIDVGFFDGIIAVRKLMREKAGTEYLFSVLRNGELKKIKLTLRDLF